MATSTEAKIFDWNLAVPNWENDLLEAWAALHLRANRYPKADRQERQVGIWAEKVLQFSKKSANAWVIAELNGDRLQLVPDSDTLQSWGVAGGPALVLFEEIRMMKLPICKYLHSMTIEPMKLKLARREKDQDQLLPALLKEVRHY